MTSRKRSSEFQGICEVAGVHSKKSKVGDRETTSKVDTNGDRYWELSKMRRVTISSFRGKNMVNVREYYEKNGQELPGKKGISMPMDQFSALIKLLPDIEQALKQQGESLPRPIYSGSADQPGDGNDEPERTASPSKQNIDATSDEESEA